MLCPMAGPIPTCHLTTAFARTAFRQRTALFLANGSIDFVYSNSLDHAFELARVLSEIARVLKTGGAFIAEVQRERD